MFRQTIVKASRPALKVKPTSYRAMFSTSALRMAEGDTGAPPKSGQPDAFQRRERASEDWAIREREKEKLLELKKKLAVQQAHLEELSNHIDELTKEQGGEHN